MDGCRAAAGNSRFAGRAAAGARSALLARHWTVWLPPGYDSERADGSAPSLCGWELNWPRRLFGPLGRAEGVDRFDPLSADDWMTLLVELRSHDQAVETADPQGWTVSRMELTAGSPEALEFVHCTSMRLLGTIVFLLVAAAACWKAGDRSVLLVSLLGGFGAAAMVLPDAYVPLASGGVLGILFCLAWRWVWSRIAVVPAAPGPQDARTPESSNSPPGSTVVRTAQLGLILLGVLLTLPLCGVARAETPPHLRGPVGGKTGCRAADVPRVRAHRRRQETDRRKSVRARAVLSGVVSPRRGPGREAARLADPAGDVSRRFGPRGRLRTPGGGYVAGPVRFAGFRTRHPGADSPPRRRRRISSPTASCSTADRSSRNGTRTSNALAFEVAEPGECRLEVALRPTMLNAGGPDGFDVAIPRVAQSRLELTLPADAPPVDVPSACGVVGVEKDPPRLVADLGPADRLTVRWHQGAASGTVGPAADVEQLVWLKVQPGSLVIDTKFKLHVLEGQVQQLQLAADPRLRLLPLPGDDPPTVQVGPESGQSRLIAFHWPHPVSDQVTLEATFLLGGATGVGNFHLPRLELLDAQATKRWLAVSVDPALDREQQKKQRLEAVSVADFLKAWKAEGPSEKGENEGWALPCPVRRGQGSGSGVRSCGQRAHPAGRLPPARRRGRLDHFDPAARATHHRRPDVDP